jgi:osmotically-inducible protein OsmY
MRRRPDFEIQRDVVRELAWETHVRAADIGVTVRDGIVTLLGTVGCWAEKHAAQDAAHRVHGVLDVANDLAIRPSWNTEITDRDIAQAVRDALEWNVFVPQTIKTDVWDGVVQLTGIVQTLRQRQDAERVIRGLDGVRGIENHIVVEPPPAILPDQLRHSIQGALERHVSREAQRISVDVRGDTVILSGAVDSWAERKAVVGAAIGTHGVRTVEDRLHISGAQPHAW